MKKQHVLVLALFTSSLTLGQEVISSQGGTYTSANGVVDYTIGEVVINTVSSTDNDVTQGFHQTNWNYLGVEDFKPDFQASVYPNPMESQLNIEVKDFTNVRYEMYDGNGKIVRSATLSKEVTPIDVLDFSSGSYELFLIDDQGKKIKNFKLIKIK